MDDGFISERQARAALERAVREGRIVLTPEETERLRREREAARRPSVGRILRGIFFRIPRGPRPNL